LKFRNKFIQISCDGGAATGKSTGAKMIAKKFKLKFLSSGLLYRYVSFLIIRDKPKDKISFIKKKFKTLKYNRLERINLHTPEISDYSSVIAKNKNIRNILKKFQIDFSKKNKNCCIEGRDISTNILPNSDIKFYFVCELRVAARRRYNQLKKIDSSIKFNEVKKALEIRNISDIKRKYSPLLKHRNSIEIDTGKLNKQAMLKKMTKHVNIILQKKYAN